MLAAYQAAKDVTLRRMYLDTMQDILTHSPPLVVDDKLQGLVPFLPLNVPAQAAPGPTTPAAAIAAASPGPSRRHPSGRPAMNRITIIGLALSWCWSCSWSVAVHRDQTEQVLVTQFGKVVRVIEGRDCTPRGRSSRTSSASTSGCWRSELPGEEVILGDQRRLIVDSFTVFRITDPLRFYQAIGPIPEDIRGRLNSVVSAACAGCSATTSCSTCCRPIGSGSCPRSATR